MTYEDEPQRASRELSEEEEAKAQADLMGDGADPDDGPPLGIIKGNYDPKDRQRPPAPSAPPTPPAE
ncbi:hypothetical protein SUDANB105_00052 [Streptomyces sp. enrichment culture]|uniref:hypothetical protein n=1 Tax=Streptomyces sp. enrichment culture TaxID=1795815 RepID=UPI003F55D34D